MKQISDPIDPRRPKGDRCGICAPAEATTRHGAPIGLPPGVETAWLPRPTATVRERLL
jgi:hypothetical protein